MQTDIGLEILCDFDVIFYVTHPIQLHYINFPLSTVFIKGGCVRSCFEMLPADKNAMFADIPHFTK